MTNLFTSDWHQLNNIWLSPWSHQISTGLPHNGWSPDFPGFDVITKPLWVIGLCLEACRSERLQLYTVWCRISFNWLAYCPGYPLLLSQCMLGWIPSLKSKKINNRWNMYKLETLGTLYCFSVFRSNMKWHNNSRTLMSIPVVQVDIKHARKSFNLSR